jgi:hypothetical protein
VNAAVDDNVPVANLTLLQAIKKATNQASILSMNIFAVLSNGCEKICARSAAMMVQVVGPEQLNRKNQTGFILIGAVEVAPGSACFGTLYVHNLRPSSQ